MSLPPPLTGTSSLRRSIKRPNISDQQKRRDIALQRQQQHRRDSQNHARLLFTLQAQAQTEAQVEVQVEAEEDLVGCEEVDDDDVEVGGKRRDSLERGWDVVGASRLKGAEARKWFAHQFMLPEWMIDVPPSLTRDWYVFARPSGKRCFVVSLDGTTVSRLKNGSVLHHFPSALPNGARTKDNSGPAHSFCLLDCIFHEPDQTYYVLDLVCWRGYPLYDCSAEFRFFWLNSKLVESGACDAPSIYHRYRFSIVPILNCDEMGLHAAYAGTASFAKDGLLFYNKHAHYQTGNTPLSLVWKDESCSQYVIDTDNQGQIPSQQQVVLELQEDGNLTTSDNPPVIFGILGREFIEHSGLRTGNLLRFAVGNGGMRFTDGKVEIADIQYVGKSNRARTFADTYSKVLFQYTARHSPLRIEDLVASVGSSHDNQLDDTDQDIEMAG